MDPINLTGYNLTTGYKSSDNFPLKKEESLIVEDYRGEQALCFENSEIQLFEAINPLFKRVYDPGVIWREKKHLAMLRQLSDGGELEFNLSRTLYNNGGLTELREVLLKTGEGEEEEIAACGFERIPPDRVFWSIIFQDNFYKSVQDSFERNKKVIEILLREVGF